MGRPRKRRLVDTGDSSQEFKEPIASPTTITNTQPVIQDTVPYDTIFGPTLEFLDQPFSQPDDDLWSLLQTNDADLVSQTAQGPHDDAAKLARFPFSVDSSLGLMNDANLNEDSGQDSAAITRDLGESIQLAWQSQKLGDRTDLGRHLDTSSSSGSQSPPPTMSATALAASSLSSLDSSPGSDLGPPVSCECLSSLYLSLDSLSRLPKDTYGALSIARRASEVAHDVVRCKVCSALQLQDVHKALPIRCFQNRMCLATLVPSTCNAYAAILDIADKQAAAAREKGDSIWFSLEEIGGITIAPKSHEDSPKLSSYNNRSLSPDLWHNVIRAIVRADVYGIDPSPPTDIPGDIYHRYGLRNVVKIMEDISDTRHGYMDKLVAEGRVPEPCYRMFPPPYRPVPPEERNCMRILDAARAALDNLSLDS